MTSVQYFFRSVFSSIMRKPAKCKQLEKGQMHQFVRVYTILSPKQGSHYLKKKKKKKKEENLPFPPFPSYFVEVNLQVYRDASATKRDQTNLPDVCCGLWELEERLSEH